MTFGTNAIIDTLTAIYNELNPASRRVLLDSYLEDSDSEPDAFDAMLDNINDDMGCGAEHLAHAYELIGKQNVKFQVDAHSETLDALNAIHREALLLAGLMGLDDTDCDCDDTVSVLQACRTVVDNVARQEHEDAVEGNCARTPGDHECWALNHHLIEFTNKELEPVLGCLGTAFAVTGAGQVTMIVGVEGVEFHKGVDDLEIIRALNTTDFGDANPNGQTSTGLKWRLSLGDRFRTDIECS